VSILARRPRTAAFGIYLLAALLLFGLPVLDNPGREVISVHTSTDPGIFIWCLRWLPHAITHGLNPFDTDLLFVPEGVNLGHATIVPGAALVLWPVTAAFGPVVSYNLAMLLAPALAAFFCFELCRRATGRFWPALLGGWLFGWSAYAIGQLTGHMNLVLVFLVPAIVLIVWRRLDGELGPRAFVALLALALVGQFLLSTEIFATLTMFGALTLAAAWWLAPPAQRAAIVRALPLIGLAYAIALVAVSPYLYYALKDGGPLIEVARARKYSNDLLAFAFPTEFERLGRRYFYALSSRFQAGPVEGAAYLGLPLLLIVASFALTTWRLWTTKLLLAVAGVTALLSLGSRLQVGGVETVPMPWAAADRLPVLAGALPARFAMFTALAVAVMAALWVSAPSPRPAWRWALALAAVAFLAPNIAGKYWHHEPAVPAFFSTSIHERHLEPDDVALVLPLGIGGNSMLWHARAGFDFRMAGGYVGEDFPGSYKEDPLHPTLAFFATQPQMVGMARRFLREHEVDAVVLDQRHTGPWPQIMAALGVRPARAGGALVYRVGA
jgi:hypothetical protein